MSRDELLIKNLSRTFNDARVMCTTAVEASEKEEGKIHALVTDLIMPGFGGLKLAELVAAKRPDIRVIYMSGYTDRTAGIEAVKSASYLQKLFSLQALGRMLRTLLDPSQR